VKMAKQKRDAKLTKANILKAAIELFSIKSFDATTVDDIAVHCNVNKAMIYYYYKNKAGLYEQAMVTLMEDIYNDIYIEYKKSKTALEGLKAFVTTYSLYAKKHPYFPALLLRELSNSGAHLPELMFFKMRKIFFLLSEILEKGVKDGIFYDVKPMIIHFMIIGTINLMITTTSIREKAMNLEDLNVDTCSKCDTQEIANYVYEKIKIMLEKKV